ncbi:MAG TPA: hypothetical protein DEG92_06125 [Rikenellaceae bacterium]|nr:hypothetical protein [Rikenellaceae bacterium]
MRSVIRILFPLIFPGLLFAKKEGFRSDVLSAEVSTEYNNLIPDSRVVINAPNGSFLNPDKPVRLILYALPNGNTIEQTEGRTLLSKTDDWHFDIQHIAAQVRFLRENDKRFNYIVAYLESSQKAWTAHASKYKDSPLLYSHLVDTVKAIVLDKYFKNKPSAGINVVLASHSGGGRFVFNYLHGVDEIPGFIERLCFIDSYYAYEELFAGKFIKWLNSGKDKMLGVISYIDTTVVYNGKPIVSKTGGTGYRSELMYRNMKEAGVKFKDSTDTSFIRHTAFSGRLRIIIKENPTGKIYHTILVEKNGLIHQLLFNSKLEERGYKFWGERSYSNLIK